MEPAYLERAVEHLRAEGETIDEALLAYLSPIGWEHVNLTADYVWSATSPGVQAGAFRPLRITVEA